MSQEIKELLEKLADEKKWEKNNSGYWVYSDIRPFAIASQALALLRTEQPPAGEFFLLTCKDMYEVIQECCGLCPWCVGLLGRYIKQERGRLDRSEASQKELLTACEAVWNDTKGFTPSDYVKLETFKKIKAAIAKEKESK